MSLRIRFFIKIFIIVVFLGGFITYGLYESWDFLMGPKIIIESPADGQTFSNSYLEIKGKAENVSFLSFNGRQIFTDENGFFKEDLLLARGYNIIEMRAEDKFGREAREKIEAVLK